jgi:hypothetical protein
MVITFIGYRLFLFKHSFILYSMDRVSQLKQIQAEALELFTRKNKDYGDAFATFGLIGVLVRIEDKIKRALTIQHNQVTLVDESIRDTLLDLHNYAAMALMLDKPNECPMPEVD